MADTEARLILESSALDIGQDMLTLGYFSNRGTYENSDLKIRNDSLNVIHMLEEKTR